MYGTVKHASGLEQRDGVGDGGGVEQDMSTMQSTGTVLKGRVGKIGRAHV